MHFADILSSPERPRSAKALWGVLVLGLALRFGMLALAWYNSPDLSTLDSPDTLSYVQPAKELLEHGQFTSSNGEPELLRVPGYSLFLIPGLLTGHLYLVTALLQIALSLSTIYFVYRLVSRIAPSPWAAIAAALLLAIEPLSVGLSIQVLSETLFTFLLIAALERLLSYLENNSITSLACSGLLLAAAAFVRPLGYFLPILLTIALVARALWQQDCRWPRLAHAMTFCLVGMAPLVAWQMRNQATAGYSGFSSCGDFNLYYFQGAAIMARQRGITLQEIQEELGAARREGFGEAHPALKYAGQAQQLAYMKREAQRLIRQHPAEWIEFQLMGLAKLLLNPGAADFLCGIMEVPSTIGRNDRTDISREPVQMRGNATELKFHANLALSLPLFVIYATSSWGLLKQHRSLGWRAIILLAVVGYVLAASSGLGVPRLRHPVMPLLCALGGVGIADLITHWQRIRQRIVKTDAGFSEPAFHHKAA